VATPRPSIDDVRAAAAELGVNWADVERVLRGDQIVLPPELDVDDVVQSILGCKGLTGGVDLKGWRGAAVIAFALVVAAAAGYGAHAYYGTPGVVPAVGETDTCPLLPKLLRDIEGFPTPENCECLRSKLFGDLPWNSISLRAVGKTHPKDQYNGALACVDARLHNFPPKAETHELDVLNNVLENTDKAAVFAAMFQSVVTNPAVLMMASTLMLICTTAAGVLSRAGGAVVGAAQYIRSRLILPEPDPTPISERRRSRGPDRRNVKARDREEILQSRRRGIQRATSASRRRSTRRTSRDPARRTTRDLAGGDRDHDEAAAAFESILVDAKQMVEKTIASRSLEGGAECGILGTTGVTVVISTIVFYVGYLMLQQPDITSDGLQDIIGGIIAPHRTAFVMDLRTNHAFINDVVLTAESAFRGLFNSYLASERFQWSLLGSSNDLSSIFTGFTVGATIGGASAILYTMRAKILGIVKTAIASATWFGRGVKASYFVLWNMSAAICASLFAKQDPKPADVQAAVDGVVQIIQETPETPVASLETTSPVRERFAHRFPVRPPASEMDESETSFPIRLGPRRPPERPLRQPSPPHAHAIEPENTPRRWKRYVAHNL
jgi:hypothetical protein